MRERVQSFLVVKEAKTVTVTLPIIEAWSRYRSRRFYGTVQCHSLKERETDKTDKTKSLIVLSGIALDLESQIMFPAIFDWGRFTDFAAQLKDAARV